MRAPLCALALVALVAFQASHASKTPTLDLSGLGISSADSFQLLYAAAEAVSEVNAAIGLPADLTAGLSDPPPPRTEEHAILSQPVVTKADGDELPYFRAVRQWRPLRRRARLSQQQPVASQPPQQPQPPVTAFDGAASPFTEAVRSGRRAPRPSCRAAGRPAGRPLTRTTDARRRCRLPQGPCPEVYRLRSDPLRLDPSSTGCMRTQCTIRVHATVPENCAALPGPYPTIVIFSGFEVQARFYNTIADRLATWGYSVIQVSRATVGRRPGGAGHRQGPQNLRCRGIAPLSLSEAPPRRLRCCFSSQLADRAPSCACLQYDRPYNGAIVPPSEQETAYFPEILGWVADANATQGSPLYGAFSAKPGGIIGQASQPAGRRAARWAWSAGLGAGSAPRAALPRAASGRGPRTLHIHRSLRSRACIRPPLASAGAACAWHPPWLGRRRQPHPPTLIPALPGERRHSMGGGLASIVAGQYPDRVAAVALLDPVDYTQLSNRVARQYLNE